jgi:hypothetical protein
MTKLPDPSSVGDDTLLRLGVAAALEFPDGSMGASGLRREALHGRLRIWRIAGKDLHDEASLEGNEGSMRPIQPPRLKLRRGRKGRRALWVIKDREREVSTGFGESERGKAEIAFAEYLFKNRQPFFGDCSGVSALLGARNDDGSWPFAGKRMTGFPRSEMADFGVAQGAPWLPEVRLIKAGARYVQGQKHTDVVVVDGNLVTGQNGASSKRTAQAVVDQVGRTAKQVAPVVTALAN